MNGNTLISLLETIIHWLIRPSSASRQWVFMPELNRKRKRKLETLAGPITCVTAKRPKGPLPGYLQWQPLPEIATPPKALYATARELVDAQVASIHSYLPNFFKNTALNIDYEATYKLGRQQRLAITGLAFLARCFEGRYFDLLPGETPNQSQPIRPLLILDSPVAPALLEDGTLARHGFPEFCAIFSSVKPFSPNNFRRRTAPLLVPKFSKPPVLLVMSAPVHYELARAALDNLEADYTIVIYFANPAKLDQSFRQHLAQRYFTVDAHTLMPTERLIKGACAYFNQRLQLIANLPVPTPLKDALNAELDQVGDTVRIMALLETVLAAVRPVAVLGCMEKNRLSAAFKTLQARYGYRLINFQHGIMPLTHNMDWLQFDRFFVWNPLTRNVVRQDGYPCPDDSLAVVGNPFWEQHASPSDKLLSKKAQEIIAWKGESPLIGAYTQYAGDYLTHEVRKNYLKVLFSYLEARPTVKMLIKKHPLETDLLVEALLAQATHLQGQIMLCAGQALDLWESFSLIQLSTTICSTTLLDSLGVNVPAVALDFTDIIANIGYGYDQELGITIIKDPQAVPALLDALLAGAITTNLEQAALQSRMQQLVYPALPGSYAERVRESLIALGLLKTPALVEPTPWPQPTMADEK
jgi:hypothetical protein